MSNTGKEEYPHEDTSYGDSQPKKIAAFIKTKIKDDIKVCFTTNKDINTLFGDNGEIGKKQEATKQNITKQALEEIGLESCLVGKINVNDGKLEAVKSLEKAKNILNIKNEDGIKLNDENFTNTQLSVGENHKVINKDLPHLIKKKTTELQANQDEIKNIIPDDNNDDFFKEYNDLANIVKKIDSGDKAKVFIDYTKEESPKAQEVETLLLGLDPGLADTKALLGGDTNINYTNKNSKEKEKNGTYQQKLSIALKHATAAIGETSINKDHAKILSKIENAKIFEEAKNYDYINIDYDNIGKFSKSEKEHLEGLIGKNPEAILNFYSKKENVEKEEPSYENEAVDAKFTKATQPLSLGDNKIYFVIGQKCYIRQAKDSNFKIEDKMEDDKNTEIGKYTKTNFVLRDHPKAVFLTQENKDSLKINFAELVDSGFGLIIDSWEDLKDITSDKCKTAITAKLTKNSITFGKPTSKVKGLTIIIEREGHIIH